MPPCEWYDQLEGDASPLAESILDRINYDVCKTNVAPTAPTNYRSMKEVYGLESKISEQLLPIN